MPPYRVLWLEMAERQYLDLPEGARRLVDERLAQLERDPLSLPDAVYDPSSDQWSAPVGAGLLLYAVVVEPATVIVLRLPSRARHLTCGVLVWGSSCGTPKSTTGTGRPLSRLPGTSHRRRDHYRRRSSERRSRSPGARREGDDRSMRHRPARTRTGPAHQTRHHRPLGNDQGPAGLSGPGDLALRPGTPGGGRDSLVPRETFSPEDKDVTAWSCLR